MSCKTFRQRLINHDPLVGTFLKTPSMIMAEVLALTDLDLFCIDAEHAPFGRLEIDSCVAAFKAADRPSLVRIANDSSTEIRNALDCGATGILVPHVASAKQAQAIVKAAHFGEGGRGFAGSPRAADYTRKSMANHLAESRAQTSIVLQIEDIAALRNVAEIAAVDGVDCLFIGRADLSVAMQKSPMDSDVIDCVNEICVTAIKAGVAVGMFTPALDELPAWRRTGASLFLLSSDQSFVIGGANKLAETFKQLG